jgi:hypothetical protein
VSLDVQQYAQLQNPTENIHRGFHYELHGKHVSALHISKNYAVVSNLLVLEVQQTPTFTTLSVTSGIRS